jgi:hypothetical protein
MNYKSLAKLFTSADISRVAEGDLSTVSALLRSFSELSSLDTLMEVYEEAYKLLCMHYPNEYIVKNTIANNVLLGTHSMKTASMLSELRIGTNKADCVIINGLSTCYEIKTQFDSLKRLPEQLNSYTCAFDKTIVIAHEKHLDALYKLHEKIPIFGIKLANSKGRLTDKIVAPLNINFDTNLMFNSLRKDEYTNIAKTVLGDIPEVPNTKMFKFCKEIFCSLPKQDANELFKINLKHYRQNDHKFINSLPKSMKNIGVSYKINSKNKVNIVDLLLDSISQHQGDMNVLSIHEGQTI